MSPDIVTREREKALAGITAGSLMFQLVTKRDNDRQDLIEFSVLIGPDHWQICLNNTMFLLDAFSKMISYVSGGGKGRKDLQRACDKLLAYLEHIRAQPDLLDVQHLRWHISKVNRAYLCAIGNHTSKEQDVYLKCMIEALGHITPVHERLLGEETPEVEGEATSALPPATRDTL